MCHLTVDQSTNTQRNPHLCHQQAHRPKQPHTHTHTCTIALGSTRQLNGQIANQLTTDMDRKFALAAPSGQSSDGTEDPLGSPSPVKISPTKPRPQQQQPSRCLTASRHLLPHSAKRNILAPLACCSKMVHLCVSMQILLLVLYIDPLLTLEIFNQREPGEATSSLIQVSGLVANGANKISAATTISNDTNSIQRSTIGGNLAAPVTANASSGVAAQQSGNSSTTLNSTLSHPQENVEDDRPLIIAIMTANIVIFIIGFIGNAVVILVILKFTRIETVTDIYIFNLAVADLMFITGLVFLITTMFVGDWIFGYLMCKLYMASTSLNQFASSLLLVVMSFDRFLAVCHPIYAQRFRRIKRAKIICLCIWIVCLILMSPIFAFAKISKDLTCAIFWPEYKNFNCEVAFTLYSFAIGFAVPLLLIAAFYLCVIRKLRVAASGQTLGSSRRSRSRESTNRRIEHLVIGIICTYTICWLPYWMTQLCVSFITNNKQPVPGFYGIFLTASSLSYTNSALNPILYAFLSDNFKRRCSDIFRSIYSFKLFQNCCFGTKSGGGGVHSYQAPTPTTTGYCETETTRPDPKSAALYLSESAKFAAQNCGPAGNHRRLTRTSSHDDEEGCCELQGGRKQQPHHDDTDDDTGSGTIALSCLNINNHDHRKKSVNFSSNTNIIMSPPGICDEDHPKNYHKINCDKNRCQGV